MLIGAYPVWGREVDCSGYREPNVIATGCSRFGIRQTKQMLNVVEIDVDSVSGSG